MVSGTKKLFIAILSVLFMFSLVFCVGSVPVKAETDYSSFEVIGAGIRVDNSKTIRFVTRIEKDVLDKIEGKVEVVTMITPERYLERAKINNADGFKADANVQMNKVVFSEAKGNLKKVVKAVDETDDEVDNPIEYYYFNGCIFDVQEHNMSYPFAARSYITVDGGDPVAYTPYDVSGEDPVVTASLFEVAEKAIASGEYSGTDLETLQKYNKTYDVHFISTDYADVTATVKHGYNLKDVAEIQHPCATVTGFSGVDSDFITSQPAGDVTVNYSIEHNFADGACKDCGLTTPEDFSFENSLSKDWAKVWVGECNLKDVTVDGKEMQKFSVNSKKNGEKTRLKLIITESGYDYVYARFYTDTVNNPDTTLSSPRIRYSVPKKPTNATAYLFDENGTSVAFGTTQNLQEWYTLVIDISDVTPSVENPLELWWDPDNGTSIGCSVYIADTMLVDVGNPVGRTKLAYTKADSDNITAAFLGIGRGGGSTVMNTTPVLFEDRIANHFVADVSKGNGTNEIEIYNVVGHSYAEFDFYVNSCGASSGTSAGVKMKTWIYMGGTPVVQSEVYDMEGNLVSNAAEKTGIKLNTWYKMRVYAGLSNALDKVNIRLTVAESGVNYDMYFSDVYVSGAQNSAGIYHAYGSSHASITPSVVDGEIVYTYQTVATSNGGAEKRGIYLSSGTNSADVQFDFMYTKCMTSLSTDQGTSWSEFADAHPNGFTSFGITVKYYNKDGLEVDRSELQLNVWYTAKVDANTTKAAIVSGDGANYYFRTLYPVNAQSATECKMDATILFKNIQQVVA